MQADSNGSYGSPPLDACWADGQKAFCLTGRGATITHTRERRINSSFERWSEMSADPAVGSPIVRSGAWKMEATIKKSHRNDGSGLWFGVASEPAGAAWAIHLYNGIVWHFPSSGSWEGAKVLCTHAALALGSDKRATPGTVVGVRVDLVARSLAFRLNHGQWLATAQATLPEIVRPWVLMTFRRDSLTLSATPHVASKRAAEMKRATPRATRAAEDETEQQLPKRQCSDVADEDAFGFLQMPVPTSAEL